MDTGTIIREALALSETDRVVLVEKLLETLDDSLDPADELAFLDELQRRSSEIDQGSEDLIPWSTLKDLPE